MAKKDANSAGALSEQHTQILLKSTSRLLPINELNAQNREALCKTASIVVMQRNDQIKTENTHRWLMYLIDGSLTLYNGKEEVGTLNAKTPDSFRPLFEDKSFTSVKASALAKVARFGREQLDILTKEQQKNAINVVDVEVSELDNLLFDDMLADIQHNKVSLASFPESTAKILGSLKQKGGIPELAEFIQTDPGLATHVVLAANRAEGSSAEPIQTIRGAISRLGLEHTTVTITELLRANTMMPSSKIIEARFRRYINRTQLAAAICWVLARELQHLKPDVAMLSALTADIGELMVITYANQHAEQIADEETLANSISNLRSICSCWLLGTWDFSPEIIQVAETARLWYRNLPGEISYADLVTAALLIIQSEMPETERSSIPSADNLLLARRLQQAGIDILSPADIIKNATSRMMGATRLLKAG